MSELDWAWGAWLGDGSYRDRKSYYWQFDSTEYKMVERFKNATGWSCNITSYTTPRGTVMYRVISSRKDPEIFPRNCNSHNKRIPDYIYSASDKDKWDFIQGLMDTDGHMRYTGASTWSMCSRDLIYGLRELLISLGKHPREVIYDSNHSGHSDQWRLECNEFLPISKYGNKVESVLGTKLGWFIDCDGKLLSDEIKSFRKKLGFRSGKGYYSSLQNDVKKNNRLAYSTLVKFKDYYGDYSGKYMESLAERG